MPSCSAAGCTTTSATTLSSLCSTSASCTAVTLGSNVTSATCGVYLATAPAIFAVMNAGVVGETFSAKAASNDHMISQGMGTHSVADKMMPCQADLYSTPSPIASASAGTIEVSIPRVASAIANVAATCDLPALGTVMTIETVDDNQSANHTGAGNATRTLKVADFVGLAGLTTAGTSGQAASTLGVIGTTASNAWSIYVETYNGREDIVDIVVSHPAFQALLTTYTGSTFADLKASTDNVVVGFRWVSYDEFVPETSTAASALHNIPLIAPTSFPESYASAGSNLAMSSECPYQARYCERPLQNLFSQIDLCMGETATVASFTSKQMQLWEDLYITHPGNTSTSLNSPLHSSMLKDMSVAQRVALSSSTESLSVAMPLPFTEFFSYAKGAFAIVALVFQSATIKYTTFPLSVIIENSSALTSDSSGTAATYTGHVKVPLYTTVDASTDLDATGSDQLLVAGLVGRNWTIFPTMTNCIPDVPTYEQDSSNTSRYTPALALRYPSDLTLDTVFTQLHMTDKEEAVYKDYATEKQITEVTSYAIAMDSACVKVTVEKAVYAERILAEPLAENAYFAGGYYDGETRAGLTTSLGSSTGTVYFSTSNVFSGALAGYGGTTTTSSIAVGTLTDNGSATVESGIFTGATWLDSTDAQYHPLRDSTFYFGPNVTAAESALNGLTNIPLIIDQDLIVNDVSTKSGVSATAFGQLGVLQGPLMEVATAGMMETSCHETDKLCKTQATALFQSIGSNYTGSKNVGYNMVRMASTQVQFTLNPCVQQNYTSSGYLDNSEVCMGVSLTLFTANLTRQMMGLAGNALVSPS